MQQDLISVIVPVYNVAKYLDRCISSIVGQTYRNLEIILCDDESSDESGTIADAWAQKDHRICVFHLEHGGLSYARNRGIDFSHGKYLSFVDSDDCIASDFIAALHDAAVSAQMDISAVGFCRFHGELPVTEYDKSPELQIFDTAEAIRQLFNPDMYNNYAWNKLYARPLFDTIRYPQGRKMEDLGTTYLLMERAGGIVYNPAPLYFYFQREDSIVNQPDKQIWVDLYELTLQRYLHLKEKYPSLEENDSYYFRVILDCYPYLEPGEKKQARADAVRLWPLIRSRCTWKHKVKFCALRMCPGVYAALRVAGGR